MSERYRLAKELFLSACELPQDERTAFLARACGDDEELRAEVEELLEVDAGEVPILEGSAVPATRSAPARPLADADWERLAGASAARSYEIAGEIARGGMGAILAVEDRDLRRELAMKVAVGPGHGGAPDLARFLEEARITAQLDHPGIAPVHELGVDSVGRLYFTMKLVRGRELSRVLEQTARGDSEWNLTRVVGLLLKVCEAMAYAHDKGVVHRDLKPSNVMVGAYGEVYVMDWGVARVLRPRTDGPLSPVRTARSESGASASSGAADPAWATTAGAVLGTPHYMAPEQARGDEVGPPADVHAVGAMLYQALAGRRPYEAGSGRVSETAPAVLARVRAGPPDPVRTLARGAPAELVAICERAMAPDPEARYASMRAMADDLRAYLEGRVVRAYESGALAEFRKWIGRNRLAASGLALALVGVIGGLSWSRQAEVASRREIDLASDFYRAQVLVAQADELRPAAPRMVPELEDWLRRARTLVERRAEQERRLARMEVLAAGNEDGLELRRQRELLASIDRLARRADDVPALVERVESRLEFARTIEERSVTGEEAARRWARAIESIRAGDSRPDYAGLELAPQLGLLPIGVDPRSGLWMFAHLETGAVPELDDAGAPLVTEGTGLVFLLVPGGTFWMGSSADPGSPNHDPQRADWEGPVREVTLAPYFLSKYEMTQAQWRRCTLENPSRWPPGGGRSATWTNPVEQVSWVDAQALMERMELTLPTEARWELACRAYAETPFPFPYEDLPLFANVSDQSFRDAFGPSPFGTDPWDDGWPNHAPVGSLEANELGFHDMHGNVIEWTLDVYGSYAHPRRAGDGLALGPTDGSQGFWSPDYRVGRGGSFESTALYARSSYRVNLSPTFVNHGLGLRPAREVDAPAGEGEER